ncbi:phosphoribosylformylglycinamidine cyclo-ligase [Anaerococcus prevotii]|uniref:Phosphoribosylformylglycinamidine cyclo-ligase n=1 Tax=Anaerococcus prevotii ACS-065-V-Col13 TaxID=879305 RepID=F0GUV1_9FIRM|nr:phosphoribosylformylglycinamidine cyclo-ligase [Anaerococcus prevotii]EGC82400.1 phosphoribosylformylglycinamidine cyclo-ligase [Anaerococcus prevotii ACS-065-V-Col13]
MAKLTYKDAGVDKNKGYEEVELIKKIVKSTHGKEVLADIGGFAGDFAPNLSGISNPVLLSGTDGVGTKIKLAMEMDKHDTVGIDCVAMCVNDILCQGGKPLFFLDYIATGKLDPQKMAELVKGVADGCKIASAALIGGETAEMPGIYKEDDYDLAGFAVGLVDKDKIIDGKDLKEGDIAIGLYSSGVHSNGFSLVRASMDQAGVSLTDKFDENITIGEKLLTPTKIYAKEIEDLIKNIEVKAISHITGGGLYENVPRVLKDDLSVEFNLSNLKLDPIFENIQKWGNIDTDEMYNTFNMGVGMVIFVDPKDCEKALEILEGKAEVVGQVTKGNKSIKINL